MFNSEEEEDYRDPETEDEKPLEGLIPMPTTKGAEALGCTPCDLTHESTGGGETPTQHFHATGQRGPSDTVGIDGTGKEN